MGLDGSMLPSACVILDVGLLDYALKIFQGGGGDISPHQYPCIILGVSSNALIFYFII